MSVRRYWRLLGDNTLDGSLVVLTFKNIFNTFYFKTSLTLKMTASSLVVHLNILNSQDDSTNRNFIVGYNHIYMRGDAQLVRGAGLQWGGGGG